MRSGSLGAWLARALFVFAASGVVFLALYPRLTLPEPSPLAGSMDLVNHAAGFLALTVLGWAGWRALPQVAIGLAAAALMLEAAQAPVPGRQLSLLDTGASLAGMALGAVLIQAGRRWAALRRAARDAARQLLRGAHATGLRLATVAFGLIFGIVGARLLGAEPFGDYISLMALAGLLTTATSLGLPQLLTREIAASRGDDDREGLKPLAQGLVLVNAAILMAGAGTFALGYIDPGLILLFALAGNACTLLAAAFAGYERVLFAGWMSGVVRPLVALLAFITLVWLLGPDERLPLIAQIIGAVVGAAVLLAAWKERTPLQIARVAWSAKRWSPRHRKALHAGAIFAATQVLINLTTQIDILILTALTDPETVAHYYAAARAALVVSFFFGSFAMLVEPKLARLFAQSDIANFDLTVHKTARIGFIATAFLALAAAAVGPFYLRLYGAGFERAFPWMCVLLAGLVVWSAFGPVQSVLRAMRGDGSLLICTGAAIATNTVFSWAAIWWVGPIGAAIGTALQFAMYGALMYRCARRTRIARDDAEASQPVPRGDVKWV